MAQCTGMMQASLKRLAVVFEIRGDSENSLVRRICKRQNEVLVVI